VPLVRVGLLIVERALDFAADGFGGRLVCLPDLPGVRLLETGGDLRVAMAILLESERNDRSKIRKGIARGYALGAATEPGSRRRTSALTNKQRGPQRTPMVESLRAGLRSSGR